MYFQYCVFHDPKYWKLYLITTIFYSKVHMFYMNMCEQQKYNEFTLMNLILQYDNAFTKLTLSYAQ